MMTSHEKQELKIDRRQEKNQHRSYFLLIRAVFFKARLS